MPTQLEPRFRCIASSAGFNAWAAAGQGTETAAQRQPGTEVNFPFSFISRDLIDGIISATHLVSMTWATAAEGSDSNTIAVTGIQ